MPPAGLGRSTARLAPLRLHYLLSISSEFADVENSDLERPRYEFEEQPPSSGRTGKEGLRCGHIQFPRSPMSQPSACGPLQLGRASLHRSDIVGTTRAMHQTHPRQNPNSRNHRERCDYNRGARTGGTIPFLPMRIPRASHVALGNGGGRTKD